MMRVPIVAANWKMNGTLEQAASIARGVVQGAAALSDAEVVLCPPYTALQRVGELLRGSRILLGAQDVHWERQGAFTGEISAPMLKELGCAYCIVGHSERRQLFQELDAAIHKKLLSAVEQGLRVILCVGETLEHRQTRRTWSVIEGQLEIALAGFPAASAPETLVIAYEPVWAIGTGRNATGAQAQEVHARIRRWLADRFGKDVSQRTRIQYGGSVNPDNAAELLSQADVDGALVGGASLDPGAFLSIVQAASHTKKGSPCSTQ